MHGPLVATLLLDLFYQRNPDIRSFQYRSRSPLFNPHRFVVHGLESGEAWAANYEGGLAMTAQCEVGTD